MPVIIRPMIGAIHTSPPHYVIVGHQYIIAIIKLPPTASLPMQPEQSAEEALATISKELDAIVLPYERERGSEAVPKNIKTLTQRQKLEVR